jgi:serine protease Do
MKTNSFPFITASMAAALVAPVFAIEAPEDDSPPPAAKHEATKLPEIKLNEQGAPAAKAQTAFLGIVTNEVPELLADHLDLKPGEGVVVRSLVPDGPAAKAGLEVNDVITRVAANPVGSPQEMSAQVTAHKPGESVALDFIRKGKSSRLDVTLGTKPDEIAAMEPQALDPLQLDGIPKDLAERIRKAVEGNLRGLDLQLGDALDDAEPGIEDAMRELKKRMQGALGDALIQPDNLPGGKVELQGGATLRMNDAQGSIEVKSNDGSKEITIRDKQDKVVWSGPWDTAQDKQAAPADVRERVESLNIDGGFKGPGLRFQMNPR